MKNKTYTETEFEAEISRKKKATKKSGNNNRRRNQQVSNQVNKGLDEYFNSDEDDLTPDELDGYDPFSEDY